MSFGIKISSINLTPEQNFYTPAKRMFSGVYWNRPVCPSVHASVQNPSFCKTLAGVLTLLQMTNLDSSKLKEVADDNFQFNENGRNLFKQVKDLYYRHVKTRACLGKG